jgi:hypothetical protein
MIMNRPAAIAAVRLGGLGDLLVALPSLRLLRTAFPFARLVLIGRPELGGLFVAAGVVDAVEAADGGRVRSLFADEAGPSAGPALVPAPGLVVGWFHSAAGEGLAAGAARTWPRTEVRMITVDPRRGELLVRAFFERTSEMVVSAGWTARSFDECLGLPLQDAVREAGRALLPTSVPASSPYAVIHPGSGSPRKCWPLRRFLDAADFLRDRGLPGAFVTGEAEARIEEELSRRRLPDGWTLLSRPPLAGLAGLLASAAVYAGNDSGVTHLAAACGVPVVAVFRDEFAGAWRPAGDVRLLRAADPAGVSSAAVREALAGALGR